MNNSLHNSSPFLQTQRDFSTTVETLSTDIFRAYVDIGIKVNERIIGTFARNKPSITGESWFITSRALQSQRQLFPITTTTSYPHGLDLAQIVGFTKIYGTVTDGSVWYPLPFVDETDVTKQISIKVTSSDIVITSGAGVVTPITSGFVVLEWLVRTSSTPST